MLALAISAPVVLATVVSCANTPDKGGSGSIGTPQLPTFVQKQLEQAQSLVVNNKTWSKITNFSATRDVKNDVESDYYITPLLLRFRDTFHYPSWDFNFKENNNGWQDMMDWGYPGSEGKPVWHRGVETSPMIFNERTEFQVGTDKKTGKPIFAKYNDPRFILHEIKNGTLRRHPAARTWFKQQISPDTKAITKQFSLPANALGSTATGLYAAPGEVITLKLSQKTLDQMIKQNVKNFKITINENYWDNKLDYNDNARMSNRYPFVQTTFTIDPHEVKNNNNVFQFGSPFGGAITINTNSKMTKPTNSIFSSAYDKYDFEISGALEMLTYTDGITTKADWDAQIERIKNQEINAPAMAIDLPLLTMNIPTVVNEANKFAGVAYDQIIYPEAVAKKMNSFMFLSEFFASRDKNGSLVKLMLRFCDDIWGKGASAWGGGDKTAMPVAWAANGFLKGLEQWNSFNANWGLFHEINHNFQQNGGLFSQRSHGETDQANTYILSMISDHGRIRNLYNPLVERDRGGWTSWNQRTSHAWNTFEYINKTKQGKGGSEYELPAILAFQLGSFNMMQYIRNDAYNAPNSHGIDEVIQLSNAFKMNLWPAIKQFSTFWAWKDWTTTPSVERQAQLDEIASKYQAVNFVANLFATGAYIYDQDKDQFLYTNDTSAPILAATNAPYVFDFAKGINSFMDTLKWDKLTFSQTTKLGGKLVQDPTNSKRLIYLPPQDVYNKIDEFDVGILPTSQGKNFVKEYRWKIKMNLVSNLPVITMFNEAKASNNSPNFYQDQAYMDDVNNYAFQAPIDVRQGIYSDHDLDTKTWQKAKASFKFVAPETGEYNFRIKGDSWFFIDIDDEHKADPTQLWWQTDKVPSKDFMDTSKLRLDKGESVKFDIYLTQRRNANTLQMQAVVNETAYDLFDHITSPFADASEALLGFTYQGREVDQNLLNHNLVAGLDNTFTNIIKTDQYRFEAPGFNSEQLSKQLAESDSQRWEVWQGSNEPSPYTKELTVKFNQPQTIGAIAFNHRTDNHWEARATKMIIKDQSGNELYNDTFAKAFNDRNKATTIVNLAKPATNISQLMFTLINERSNAFSLNSIKFSPDSWHYLNRIVDAQNPAIKYFGNNWNLLANDVATNVSQIGTHYATNNGKFQYLEFAVNATGFDIIGQRGLDLGAFDLYVNDQFVSAYDTKNSETINSQILATYRTNDWATSQPLKIKIVNRDDKPINIDGLQVYGRQVEV